MSVAASTVIVSFMSSKSIQSVQLRVVVDAMPRVAAVVKVAKEEAVMVVVPDRTRSTVFAVSVLPAPPFKGLIAIFPVVSPPMVRV